jgi:hypothetical protein
MKPCIWLFWTDTGEFWSRAIRFATGGEWSHMGIGFDLEDGTREYYEALFSGGFTGPLKPSKLAEFLGKDASNRCCIIRLDPRQFGYSPGVLFEIHANCKAWSTAGASHRGYNRVQLAGMLLFERWGVPLRHSENKVVCSEAVSRLLERIVDLRDYRHTSHDTVSPASAWRRVMSILAGYELWTRAGIRAKESADGMFEDAVTQPTP